MFKLRKQKSKKPAAEQLGLDPNLSAQIHVMPKRFYVAPKKKHLGLIIIIVVGVLLIGSLAAVAIYLSQDLNQKPVSPATNQGQEVGDNINQEPVLNQNLNQNFDANVNSGVNANISTSTNINVGSTTTTNTNTNANANVNTNTNANINSGSANPLGTTADLDGDGLTDGEERLYGTNPEISDSDGDGYPDAAELLNGYDPTKPAASLADSGLFISYSHPAYSIIYPRGWEVRQQGETKDEVLFIAATDEFIEVLIIPNISGLSLSQWYEQEFSVTDSSQLTVVEVNNLPGLRSSDNRNYYLIKEGDKSQIFILTYNIGNASLTNFATTFQIMVKNFRTLL